MITLNNVVSILAGNRCLHLLFALFIVVTLTATFLVKSPTTVQATPTASDSLDVQVDHIVQIRNGGLLIINDTVKLFAKDGELELDKFTLGFPFIYQYNLDDVFAYDASNQQLDVRRDVGLGKIGFYGVEVIFPQSIKISNEEHYEFTVVFVFSNLISFKILSYAPEPGKEATRFNATFPAYPSLTQTASTVNLTITLPSSVKFSYSSFNREGIKFTNRTMGDFQAFNYTKSNLEPFAYKPSWLSFKVTDEPFLIFEVKEIKRDIKIENPKHVLISDSYEIAAKAESLSKLTIQLLRGAYEIAAWDEFGSPFKKENLKIEQGNATTPTNVTLTFSPPVTQNKSAKFKLTYQVLWENVISQSDWKTYQMTLSSFENSNWITRKLVVILTLPEGAEFTNTPDSGVISKNVFQETLTFIYYNITPFQNPSQEATYEYIIFWASFRPTLWVGTAVAIISVLALLWRAPRPTAPIPTIPVKPEELKSYVDAYEQKRRSLNELETLEEKARKRKIPRRRYKVRKRALESRLSVLSKDLARLREKLRTASPKYADMMRQIEIAEAELEGIEAGIRRTETRYRRGEISTAAYHKLLEDYYRRRERSRTTIDGVLLRLREEIA
jgi:hypothetical protein